MECCGTLPGGVMKQYRAASQKVERGDRSLDVVLSPNAYLRSPYITLAPPQPSALTGVFQWRSHQTDEISI